MTKIEAIIRPNKLEDVKAALDDLGLMGVTVSHVMGSGRQRGRTRHYRGQEYVVNLLDKVKVETVVTDEMVNSVMNAIADAAGTGEIGDGKIFVYRVDNAMRIRTREAGEAAVK
ncbi:MAG: transcriptional regulator [Armatimonadetes bacterium RBG_16_58_9]|nr:MAG: transcriptional regulator [Armatimonadetes bacterium RBG_16_58_9]